ncbi:MAG: 2-succinyl-5-enolpyruvyl-6-hydroxy-3-cyclohexene-1-carboxylic-acid synthase [Candidatus Algichlamydia australiensis]|nr:2-succinyl-5-enolpyruvyl-6-hydroxy-3-cyclohexene-1-carboxylic-acid synthase [Chlamydiales bacterium]
MDNVTWAKIVVKELIHQKVRYFCIAPGSRSTPLIMAIHEHPLAQVMTHFDERGVGFHALGYAKASGMPVALVATSGTALGNMMPAVMEAYHDEIPLIVLTADRPPELQDCGANQTTDQLNFFGTHVKRSINIDCPSNTLSPQFLQQKCHHALQNALSLPQGPVQINCQFRKPLVGKTSQDLNLSPKRTYFSTPTIAKESMQEIADELMRHEKGVIIAGRLSLSSEMPAIAELARKLNWPILPDILSHCRDKQSHTIPHFEAILGASSDSKNLAPTAVLHLGKGYMSRTLLDYLAQNPPEKMFHVGQKRFDPAHIVTDHIKADPLLFTKELASQLKGSGPNPYTALWQDLNRTIAAKINTFFETKKSLSEMEVARLFSNHLGPFEALFLSNSMPIRDFSFLYSHAKKSGPLFANRGLSGIDGNIATAIGIAKAVKKRTWAVIGDLAFLHDLNSLAQLKRDLPITFFVINNGGGGIYSFRAIRSKKEFAEEALVCSHARDFRAIAEQFSLQYLKPKNREELEEMALYSAPQDGPCIIEIESDREENYAFHKSLNLSLKGFDKKLKPRTFATYGNAL